MKSFGQMSCKFNRLFETSYSFSKTIPLYLQYGKELFAGWSCHTHLTGLWSDQPPLGYSRPAVHDCIPSQLPHFLNSNTSWLNNGNVFHEGVGYNHRLLLSMRKSLIECIHKGGGHTRYAIYKIYCISCMTTTIMQYINV